MKFWIKTKSKTKNKEESESFIMLLNNNRCLIWENHTVIYRTIFLTLETGISTNFDGGWDKPIPEVIHL